MCRFRFCKCSFVLSDDHWYVQLTSEAFCSSAVGIDKSSLSANAIVGDNVVIAAMEANEVFMKADLSQVDDDVSCAQRETS